MLRSLSIHAVRKRKDNSWLFFPFGLSANYEIVDCDCCSIGKVSKLSLPNDQTVWICDWVSILKAKDTVLAEMTVGYSDWIWDGFQEDMFFNISFLVTDESMTMREGTSLYILSWDSDIVAFF